MRPVALGLPYDEMKEIVASATKWSFFSELVSRLVPACTYILLIRILVPEDFGIVAVAVMIVGLSKVLTDAGLSKALIRHQEDPSSAASTVFWTNAVLGIAVYGVCFAAADGIATLFNDVRIGSVVKVQGIQILFSAMFSVHVALFQKHLDFRKLFWIRLAGSGIPSVISLVFAYIGYGYWALVIGSVIGSFFEMVLLWWLCAWRMKFIFELDLLRTLFKDGWWITLETFLGWAFAWVDLAIVARFLDIHTTGVYRTGGMIVMLLFAVLIGPVLPVLFSWFSRIQDERDRLNWVLTESTKLLSMIAFPSGCILWMLSDYVEILFLDAKWQGVGAVIGYVGLAYGISYAVAANNEAYRAIGRADIATKLLLFSFIYYLPVYLLTVSQGLELFLMARVILACSGAFLHIYVCSLVTGLNLIELFVALRGTALAVAAMLASMALVKFLFDGAATTLWEPAVIGSTGALAYILMQYKEWDSVKETVYSVIRA
jgi:PST family polysaccharide transporter